MKRTLASVLATDYLVLAANIEEPDQKSAMKRSNALNKKGGFMVSHSYTRRWIGIILVNSYYLYLTLQEFMFVDFDIENGRRQQHNLHYGN